MVAGLPLDKGDWSDGSHILSVSLTLSCPFSGSHRHFLGERLACGSAEPEGPGPDRQTMVKESVRDPQASCILLNARQWKVHHFV